MTWWFFSSNDTPLASSSHCKTIDPAKFGRDRRRSGDLVHHQPHSSGIDIIEHVIQRGSQTVDVLAIERSDEALIELGDDGMGAIVAAMFDLL